MAAYIPWVLACILLALNLFQAHLLDRSMGNSKLALENTKRWKEYGDAWKKLANDIVAMNESKNTIVATLDGYDVSIFSFDENEERQARQLLTDLKKAFKVEKRLDELREEKKEEGVEQSN